MPFRFGYQCTSALPADVRREAQRAEAAGFDVFQVGDHIGAEPSPSPSPSPFLTLAAAAVATRRIRLGTLVLNNDLRHPVLVAHEFAALDHLSDGRVEVGLGAGHSFTEYRALGLGFDPPKTRKERLSEAVEIVRSLLDGHRTTFRGRHYEVEDATVLAPQQEHVPILVGVNGREALAHAARHADVVAPTMLGRTLPDGQHHEARWEASRLDATISWLSEASSEPKPPLATGPLQVHALVQAVVVTDRRERAAEAIAKGHGLSIADALETPFLCIGDHVQIADHLVRCRERWGIGYYSVRCIDEFEPVIRLLREREEPAG